MPPGNRAVVHHIIVFVRPPGEDRATVDDIGAASWPAYAPGVAPRRASRRHGQACQPARSWSSRCTTRPTATRTRPDVSVGLMFADAEDVKHEVKPCRRQSTAADSARRATTTSASRHTTFPKDATAAELYRRTCTSAASRSATRPMYPDGKTRDPARRAAVRLQLADQLRAGRAEACCPRARARLHGPLRQLGGQPGQSRSHEDGSTGATRRGKR